MPMIYISHRSALFYWRTNPSWYILEGADRNIRALQASVRTVQEYNQFDLPEIEFGPSPIDVLVPSDADKFSKQVNYHVIKGKLPPHSLYPIRDGIHVVSPELCLIQMCNLLPLVEAIQLGMEFCGTYALRPGQYEAYAQRDYRLVDADAFLRHTNAWKGIRGIVPARRVARYLANDAASPMETILYLLLCLPVKLGGYGLPRPVLNERVDLDEHESLLLRKEYLKPDLKWENAKLIVEYEGEYHNDEEQRVKDEQRRVVLETKGYTVLSLKKQQVYDPIAFDGIARMLAKKLGKRLYAVKPQQLTAREELRATLLGNGTEHAVR